MIKLVRLITELLYQLMICVCHCFAVYKLFETNDFSLMKFTQVCYPCFKVPAGCITCAATGSVCYNLITVCLIIFGSKFVIVSFTSELAENTSGNFFQADIGAAIRETFRFGPADIFVGIQGKIASVLLRIFAFIRTFNNVYVIHIVIF